MKYIRTKDGRIIDLNSKSVSSYEIIDDKTAKEEYGEYSGFICVYYFDENIGEHIEYDNKGGRSMDNWYLNDIIKQADYIEELCDEFVYIDEKHGHLTYKQLCDWREDDIDFIKKGTTIYGAIWTEWGLKYVAKMNDKGELELL